MVLGDPTLEKQLQGHKSKVTCVTFNPRYPAIATGDLGNNIMLWNPKKWGNSLK
jgi:WD40 repeat protein